MSRRETVAGHLVWIIPEREIIREWLDPLIEVSEFELPEDWTASCRESYNVNLRSPAATLLAATTDMIVNRASLGPDWPSADGERVMLVPEIRTGDFEAIQRLFNNSLTCRVATVSVEPEPGLDTSPAIEPVPWSPSPTSGSVPFPAPGSVLISGDQALPTPPPASPGWKYGLIAGGVVLSGLIVWSFYRSRQ